MTPAELRALLAKLSQVDAIIAEARAAMPPEAKSGKSADLYQLSCHLSRDMAPARAHIQQMLWRMEG